MRCFLGGLTAKLGRPRKYCFNGRIHITAITTFSKHSDAKMADRHRPRPFTIHASVLFDPKKKQFVENVSIKVDPASGSILDVYERMGDCSTVPAGDIDLRGFVTMPGLVDAHTHIFLHSYEYAPK